MPTLKIEPTVATRLIDWLATDDGFRQRFVDNTAAALHEAGHIADVAELNAFLERCYFGVKLADKETISGAREEIYKMLTRGTSHIVPQLDANNAQPRSLRVGPDDLKSHAA